MTAVAIAELHAAERDQALAAFWYGIRNLQAACERRAAAEGLAASHYYALVAVRGLPESKSPSLTLLAQQLRLKHADVRRIFGDLVERGLLAGRRSEDDGRAVCVDLTPRGARLLDDLSASLSSELRDTANELMRLLAMLRRA